MSIYAFEARSANHQAITPRKVKTNEPKVDEFPYGSRNVIEKLPNGEETYYEVPLTAEDFLDPQLGDQMIQHAKHQRSNIELFDAFDNYYANNPNVAVFSDLKMVWGIPGLKEPAPDVAVIPNVKNETKKNEPSVFDVLKEGTLPCLVIEMMSPNYPGDDTTKVKIYEQAGVQEYIIINPHTEKANPFYEIWGYRLESGKYKVITPNKDGCLLSQTTGVLFGIFQKKRRLRLKDAQTGKWLLNARESESGRLKEVAARKKAEEQAKAETIARQKLEAEMLALKKRLRELEGRQK
jgi:Uma2 family endonuclease